jgi:phosphoserine aminotransferase
MSDNNPTEKPINLLHGKTKANYAHTGHWSKKAMAEAQRYCGVNICTDSSDNDALALPYSRSSSCITCNTCFGSIAGPALKL